MKKPTRIAFTMAAAAGILAAGSLMTPPPTPEVNAPKAIVQRKRKRDSAKQKRHDRRKENERNRRAKGSWLKRLKQFWDNGDRKAYKLIQSMTNWQNHQWRKAGGKRDLPTVTHYAELGSFPRFIKGAEE